MRRGLPTGSSAGATAAAAAGLTWHVRAQGCQQLLREGWGQQGNGGPEQQQQLQQQPPLPVQQQQQRWHAARQQGTSWQLLLMACMQVNIQILLRQVSCRGPCIVDTSAQWTPLPCNSRPQATCTPMKEYILHLQCGISRAMSAVQCPIGDKDFGYPKGIFILSQQGQRQSARCDFCSA